MCEHAVYLVRFLFLCYRYQFFLQLKQDILQGRVPVTQELMAELGAYVVQCEYDDNARKKPSHVGTRREQA